MDVNSTGKWGMNQNFRNHKQHAIGVVYRFDVDKKLNKKDQEKIDGLEASLLAEQTRVQDSIADANKANAEAVLLAKQQAEAAEKERLALIEKEKAEKKNKIQGEIDNLDSIYFAFDSSNLTTTSKTVLNNLLSILNTYPELTLEITSHTDSRGSAAYNQVLSEKRLKSTLDYLLNNGIEKNRIEGKAFGESRLINRCDENTKCTEDMHKENRRSEIHVIEF
ncbi:OmpA family protein [Formosa sediminum]|uniref:OmpA family protein n=2 Tax=Formosa sediminum TaxID=2594004 RepID=A0A516GW18_9FLAO|nr:OmpA family protein [Formosa sediminum]